MITANKQHANMSDKVTTTLGLEALRESKRVHAMIRDLCTSSTASTCHEWLGGNNIKTRLL